MWRFSPIGLLCSPSYWRREMWRISSPTSVLVSVVAPSLLACFFFEHGSNAFWVVAPFSALGAKCHGCGHVIDLEESWFRAEACTQESAWQVEVGLPWLWVLDLVAAAVLLRKKLQSRRRRIRYRTLVISCLRRVLNFCPWQWCFPWPLPCIHGCPLAVGSRISWSETWKIYHMTMLNSSSCFW